jgi:O-antigen/teichoic acid export membrane protein
VNHRLYLSQVSLLFGATAIAQAINFALYPFLSRTYDSADFGTFSIFVSAVSIIGPLAAGRFDIVVQAAPFAQRHAALALATLISIPVAIASGAAYGLFGPALGMPALLSAALFALAVFLIAFNFTGTAFLIKHEAYRANGQAIIARSALTALPQLALFWVLPDERGLTIGFVIGILAQASVLYWTARRLGRRRSRGRRMGALLSRYRQYPLYDVPSTFLSVFTLYAANFFLFDLYGARETGFFAFAFRLAGLPMALLAGSLSEVFFQKAARAFHSEGAFWKPLKFNLAVAGGFALLILVLTVLLARFAVRIYLGADWDPVATVLIILSPMMAARFLFITVSAAPLVTGHTGRLLAANAALAAVTVVAYLVALQWNLGFTDYLALTSVLVSSLYSVIVAGIAIQTHRNYR